MTNEVKNIPALRFSGFEGEWEEKLIKDILEFENNRRKPVTSTIREIGNYPYYGASGIIDYVKDYIFNNERRLLIGEDGAKWGSFEESSFIATGRYWVNNHAHVAKSELNNLIFLNNLLNYKELRTYVTGNAPAKLTYNNLCNIPILLPSIEEQNKIGNFFIKLDRQIELEEKKLAKLEEQKKGYMQKIFSQELRFKDEYGNDYPEWKKKKLDDVANYRRGSFPQPYGNKEWYDEKNGEPFVQVVDVDKNMKLHDQTKQKISDLAKSKSVKGFKGDIVVTLQGSIGRVALLHYDAYIDRTLLLIDSFKIEMNKNYFKYVLYLLFLKEKERAPGGTIKTITKKVLSNFKIDIPNVGEQEKIGKFFEKYDKCIQKQSNKIELLKKRKKSFLQKMFV